MCLTEAHGSSGKHRYGQGVFSPNIFLSHMHFLTNKNTFSTRDYPFRFCRLVFYVLFFYQSQTQEDQPCVGALPSFLVHVLHSRPLTVFDVSRLVLLTSSSRFPLTYGAFRSTKRTKEIS